MHTLAMKTGGPNPTPSGCGEREGFPTLCHSALPFSDCEVDSIPNSFSFPTAARKRAAPENVRETTDVCFMMYEYTVVNGLVAVNLIAAVIRSPNRSSFKGAQRLKGFKSPTPELTRTWTRTFRR